MKPLGRHFLIELFGCNSNTLNDPKKISEIMTESAIKANATIIHLFFHQFSPHGVSGIIVIAESHISVHTWPEHKYAAVDFFTCSPEMNADKSIEYLIKELEAEKVRILEIGRGLNIEDYELNNKFHWEKYGK